MGFNKPPITSLFSLPATMALCG